jgi:hypothetical protein
VAVKGPPSKLDLEVQDLGLGINSMKFSGHSELLDGTASFHSDVNPIA